MSNTLSVRLSSRKTAEGDVYEGTVSIAGLKPTKLVRRADGSTQFPTRSAVAGSARNLAKSLGFSDVGIVDASAPAQKTATKKAAKKSSVTNPSRPANNTNTNTNTNTNRPSNSGSNNR